MLQAEYQRAGVSAGGVMNSKVLIRDVLGK